jgi:hypothetical protein
MASLLRPLCGTISSVYRIYVAILVRAHLFSVKKSHERKKTKKNKVQ